MAHKKGLGSSRNGRDSHAQRLGVKKFAGEHVLAGNIIVRAPFRLTHRWKLVRQVVNTANVHVNEQTVP